MFQSALKIRIARGVGEVGKQNRVLLGQRRRFRAETAQAVKVNPADDECDDGGDDGKPTPFGRFGTKDRAPPILPRGRRDGRSLLGHDRSGMVT